MKRHRQWMTYEPEPVEVILALTSTMAVVGFIVAVIGTVLLG